MVTTVDLGLLLAATVRFKFHVVERDCLVVKLEATVKEPRLDHNVCSCCICLIFGDVVVDALPEHGYYSLVLQADVNVNISVKSVKSWHHECGFFGD